MTDRTTLKQAVINILGRSIKNSPKKGEICLTLFSQEEAICLECRDNGYLGESSLKERNVSAETALSLDCMSLEKEDMDKLVKSLGGTLSAFHKPYKGNTFLLQLPYKAKKTNSVSGNNNNVVSFAALKNKR